MTASNTAIATVAGIVLVSIFAASLLFAGY
jgi:hypothetical protein